MLVSKSGLIIGKPGLEGISIREIFKDIQMYAMCRDSYYAHTHTQVCFKPDQRNNFSCDVHALCTSL